MTSYDRNSDSEVKVQTVSVTSQGQPLVERKQEVKKSKLMECQDTLGGYINSLAVFEKMTIALSWFKDDRPTYVYVKGQDEAEAKAVKERITRYCPKAYRVVCMVKDGQEKMVIINMNYGVRHDIKILSLGCDDVEDLHIDASHFPYAVTVDDKHNFVYTDMAVPLAIRKKTGSQMETLFTNQDGNEVLHAPWNMTTNVNGDIIVADGRKNSLFIFNGNGELINTYKDFTPGDGVYPGGVCTCPAGWIYVNDWYGDCVHRLDKTGTFKDYAVTKEDGLSEPTVLKWYNGMLIVGQGNGHMKIFKL